MADLKDKKVAEQAFIRLTELWNQYNELSTPTKAAPAKNVIKTKKHAYDLGDVFDNKGMYARYNASYDAGYEKCQLLILKDPKDSDLAASHIAALKKINKEVPDSYMAFFPEFVESFRYRTEDNVDHTVISQKISEGFRPFTNILEVYPEGIGGRDIAWIFKRMLIAVGNAHDIGLVHGSPTLDTFWVHPELHGIVLSDWQYSVQSGEPLKAVSPDFKNDYPGYVFDKENVDYGLDIYLCAKTAQRLMRKDAPSQLNAFFKACMLRKPLEAKYLLNEFDLLLRRIYGEPKFNPFTLNP
jgi:hypothetical protein